MTSSSAEVAVNIVRGCLLLTLPAGFDSETIRTAKEKVLESLAADKASYLVIDFSLVNAIDSYEFEEFINLMKMAKLLGATPALAGVQPGVVFALMDLNVDTSSFRGFLDLESALDALVPESVVEASETKVVAEESGEAVSVEKDVAVDTF